MSRTYKIRSFQNGRNKAGDPFVNYSVTIPTPLAEKILEDFLDGVEFECELTDEGILYRPVEPREDVPAKLPFKVGKRTADNGASAPEPAAKRKPGRPKGSTKTAAVAPKAKAAPKPAARAKPGPKPKAAVAAKAKPGPKPKAKATASVKPSPAVRKPTGKAAPKVGAPKPRAPRPAAKK